MTTTLDVADLCRDLATIPTAVVSDVLQAGGLPDQVLSFELLHLHGEPFAGPAVCIAGRSEPPVDLAKAAALVFDADRAMAAGCVAVVATDRHRVGAVVGGNTVASWHMNGCRAVVTDGLVRDLEAMDELSVRATGRTVLNTKGRWYYHTLMEPVRIPGQTTEWVVVEPGDIVHGDHDGVIVIPSRIAERTVRDARRTLEEENRMMAAIRSGADREDVYRTSRRFDHITPYT